MLGVGDLPHSARPMTHVRSNHLVSQHTISLLTNDYFTTFSRNKFYLSVKTYITEVVNEVFCTFKELNDAYVI